MSASPSFAAIAPGSLAVVTGGASGIGLAAARAFADAGLRVCIVDRTGDSLDAAAASITDGAAYAVDVADGRAVADLAATILRENGPVSVPPDTLRNRQRRSKWTCPPFESGDVHLVGPKRRSAPRPSFSGLVR